MKLDAVIYSHIIRPRLLNAYFLAPRIRRLLPNPHPRVLDFGCGTGPMAFIFCPCHYIGVDVDLARLQYAQARFPRHTFKHVCEGQQIPIPSRSMDVVFICGVLHHLPDWQCLAVMLEFKRVLGLGGIVVAMEPVLSPSWPLHTAAMKLFDKGSYLRSANEYRELFDSSFDPTVHETFRTPNLYNSILISATPRLHGHAATDQGIPTIDDDSHAER